MPSKYFSHVRLYLTLWTVAHQAPLSMEFSRQAYWRYTSISLCKFLWVFFLFFFFKWLYWIFFSLHRLSLVTVSEGYFSLRCMSFSLWWHLLLQNTDSRCKGFYSCCARAQWSWPPGFSCSKICGIFLDEGSNPCPLHRQADSSLLHQQGSPAWVFKIKITSKSFIICTRTSNSRCSPS